MKGITLFVLLFVAAAVDAQSYHFRFESSSQFIMFDREPIEEHYRAVNFFAFDDVFVIGSTMEGGAPAIFRGFHWSFPNDSTVIGVSGKMTVEWRRRWQEEAVRFQAPGVILKAYEFRRSSEMEEERW